MLLVILIIKNMTLEPLIGLIFNWFLPGLGTLARGQQESKKTGIYQVLLSVVGALLAPLGIGVIVLMFSWFWALYWSAKDMGILKPGMGPNPNFLSFW